MPVEVGELEVVAPPAPDGGPGRDRADAAAAPSGPLLASEVERRLALEHTRDLRLRAD